MNVISDLREAVRTIPDYPKPGIMFRDITTLLGNPQAFRRAVDELVQPWAGMRIDKVAGMEARGFILGGAVAHQLSSGFVPIRKKGKLPYETVSIAYSLEYGVDEMEMHRDAVGNGERVILVDDLIATGGTAEGAVKLLQGQGADVIAACFVIDLPELGGAKKIEALGVPVRTPDRFRRTLIVRRGQACALTADIGAQYGRCRTEPPSASSTRRNCRSHSKPYSWRRLRRRRSRSRP